MRLLKLSIVLLISLSMFSGCKFKKKGKGDGSLYGGTDVALEEFPLDTFFEPVGSDTLILKEIHFDYDSYKINASEQEILTPIIGWLKDNAKSHLLVEGHCDERGSNEYNLALGEQRALAVRQFFINSGIKAGRIQTISYGEERPLDPGHDENAFKQNRRAHFLVSNG
ncbi:MAG: hypothetical protein ACD_79C00466G0015 [uncultured bacterium]|nr:MAG: hypothetical protein ACD_79C00466G0015 [uncultured bacterium]